MTADWLPIRAALHARVLLLAAGHVRDEQPQHRDHFASRELL